jgi:hypothetical protein
MRYCNWRTISATRSDRLISLLLKVNKHAASRLYQEVCVGPTAITFQPRKTALRKMTAAFSPPLRIFPQKIHPLCAYNGTNAVKTRSFAASNNGTEIALV